MEKIILKLKKIIFLLVFTLLIGFFCCNNVNAATTRVKTKGIGAYYHGFKASNGNWLRYGQLQSFYIASGPYANLRTYCIAPGEIWYSSKDYIFIYPTDDEALDKINDTQDKTKNKLTQEQLNLISQYAYYGYGYGNHNSNIYIVATQMLIYRVIEAQVFTNTNCANHNCYKINDPAAVAEAMKEIQGLVDKHFLKPSFHSTSYKIAEGETIILTDTNNIINSYEVDSCTNCNASIEGNNLKITATKAGELNVSLKKSDYYDNELMFLASSESQNMLVPGNLDPVISNVYGEVYSGDFELYKTNEDGTIKLSGAKYNIYDSNNEKVCTITTNGDGYGKCTGLKLGTYTLKESEAPIGYIVDDKTYTFKVTESENSISLSLTNKMIEGFVEIQKFDSETLSFEPQGEAKLVGAEYSIYTEDDTFIEKLIVNNNNYAKSSKLKYGRYYILETKAPEGYKTDLEKHYFEITENNQIISLKLSDEVIRGKIRIKKIDENGNPLSGVKIGIFDLKDNLINEFITDENGMIETIIEYGKYYYQEIETLDGYLLDNSKHYFEVIEDNETIEKNIINNLVEGSFELTKTDFATGEPVAGALIEIYDESNKLVFSDRTDENGKILVTGLKYGKYSFKETEAPVGYILNDELHYFEILEDGTIVKDVITNEVEKIEVPKTSSNTYFWVIPSLLMISGTILLIISKKKERR